MTAAQDQGRSCAGNAGGSHSAPVLKVESTGFTEGVLEARGVKRKQR